MVVEDMRVALCLDSCDQSFVVDEVRDHHNRVLKPRVTTYCGGPR